MNRIAMQVVGSVAKRTGKMMILLFARAAARQVAWESSRAVLSTMRSRYLRYKGRKEFNQEDRYEPVRHVPVPYGRGYDEQE